MIELNPDEKAAKQLLQDLKKTRHSATVNGEEVSENKKQILILYHKYDMTS